MKRYERIVKEVSEGVKEQMQFEIEMGNDSMNFEKYYGSAVVVVGMYQRHTSFGWMTFTDVNVAHEDGHKVSPMLQKAIEKALPDWDRMKREYDEMYN